MGSLFGGHDAWASDRAMRRQHLNVDWHQSVGLRARRVDDMLKSAGIFARISRPPQHLIHRQVDR